jgi:hypothetical protein
MQVARWIKCFLFGHELGFHDKQWAILKCKRCGEIWF